jgi:two-component system cell cycle response regulator DivK
MDVQMPVLDGHEATRRLREAGQTLPIVAVTAHARNEDRDAAYAAGCDGFVTKPIDIDQLRSILREVLTR